MITKEQLIDQLNQIRNMHYSEMYSQVSKNEPIVGMLLNELVDGSVLSIDFSLVIYLYSCFVEHNAIKAESLIRKILENKDKDAAELHDELNNDEPVLCHLLNNYIICHQQHTDEILKFLVFIYAYNSLIKESKTAESIQEN